MCTICVPIKFCSSRVFTGSRDELIVVCVLDVKAKMGYWDLQEGKDCVEKTWITTKLGTAIGKPERMPMSCQLGR